MKEVVPLPRRRLGRAARGDLRGGHVIDDDLGPVLRPPLLREHLVEPPVVPRHVVAPLDDPQRLPSRRPPPAAAGSAPAASAIPPPSELPPRHAAAPLFFMPVRDRVQYRAFNVKSRPVVPISRGVGLLPERSSRPREAASAPRPSQSIIAAWPPRSRNPVPSHRAPGRERHNRRGPAGRNPLRILQDDLPDVRACLAVPRSHPQDRRGRRPLDPGGLAGRSGDDPALLRTSSASQIPTLYDAEPWTASEALGLAAVPTFLLSGPMASCATRRSDSSGTRWKSSPVSRPALPAGRRRRSFRPARTCRR